MSYLFDFKIVSHFIIFITFFYFCLYSVVLISQKEFSAVFVSWYFLAVQNTEVGKGVSISSHLIFQETSFWHRCFSTSYSHSLLPKSVNNSAFSNFSFLNFSFFFRSFLWKKEHFRRDLLTEYLHTCRSLSSFSFRDRQFVACCLFRPFLRTCDDLVSKKVKKSFLMPKVPKVPKAVDFFFYNF